MADPQSIDNKFLINITEIVNDNISNEQFGVSELAGELGMSRSNLLRKIKKISNLSVSQFIRQVRLQRAMEMLKEDTLTVSEISYKVGFSSTSYFIKCFGDQYGYPPGEVGKRGFNDVGSSTHVHQLCAIMFTDIQGYTALMQRDEKKAVEYRNRHREVFNSITKKFKGKILQYYGDGTLSTFNSAIDAVKCGIELQLAFQQEPAIPVRIGIHSGDIIFTEDDIIGDGVNVASRIESLSSVASVLISDKVYDEVKNQTGIQTVSLGEFQLKNVGKPMEIFAISNPGLVIPEKGHIEGKLELESKTGDNNSKVKKGVKWFKWILIVLITILAGYLIAISDIFKIPDQKRLEINQTINEKSIAVLPFINDSDDSSNVYIVNGLMESILNNLQKIRELRVISRTSVEKYRNNPKMIQEIARELNVKYLIEGSGQKLGDHILLNIQLIDANSDRHLWSEQYNRQAKDIFQLQMEVAKNIADKIEVIITPEEEEQINKIPTENLLAYDYFLKGLDFFYKGNKEGWEESILWFEKAIELDEEFSRAYADIAIAYYLLDAGQADKKYTSRINNYADKALFYDDGSPQSLVAKAFSCISNGESQLAVPYLEKALEYHPNSAMVINTLSEFYTNISPNTAKYLEFALQGIRIDIASHDSITASYIYLHLSNAFIQSGFIDEAELYINKSLDYNPENLYSEYVKSYILYSKDRDLEKLKNKLIKTLSKDSSRLDILQEVGKVYFFQRDYERSYYYYKKFIDARKTYQLNIYNGENSKIGVVLSKVGLVEEAAQIFEEYRIYAENDQSIYKHLSLSVYNAFKGNQEKAIDELRLFSQQKNYHYWTIIFLEMDPVYDDIKELPEFKLLITKIKNEFWENHNKLKAALKEKELI